MKKPSPEDLQILRGTPLLGALAPEAAEALLKEARVGDFPAGSLLFVQDDPADRFFAIISGWVKLSRVTPDGKQAVIGVFTRGESFAEAAIFDSASFPVTAEVVEPARLLVIPSKPFLAALRDNFDITLTIMAAMSRRLRYMVQQLEQLQGKSAPQRVGHYLLRLCNGQEVAVQAHLPIDKSLIAARLGMKPETFSRALATLKSVGVTITGHDVTVTRPVELRKFCEGDSWA